MTRAVSPVDAPSDITPSEFARRLQAASSDTRTVGYAVITVDRDGDVDLDSALVLDQADAEEQVAVARRFTERHGRPERHGVVALVLHGDIR